MNSNLDNQITELTKEQLDAYIGEPYATLPKDFTCPGFYPVVYVDSEGEMVIVDTVDGNDLNGYDIVDDRYAVETPTPELTVYVGLLEQNNYFGEDEDAEDLAIRWCEALRQIAVRDGVDLTIKSGASERPTKGNDGGLEWWDSAAEEALTQTINFVNINTGSIGEIE